MKFEDIDWAAIQKDSDAGVSSRELKLKYKVGGSSMHRAVSSGLLKMTRKPLSIESRNKLSVALKLRGYVPRKRRGITPEKECSRCKIVKPLDQYYLKAATYDGRQSACMKCRQLHSCEYIKTIADKLIKNKNLIIERNRRYIDNILLNSKCSECECDDHRLLEFHHLSDKSINVSYMMWHTIERIDNEIKKCIILCANCHRLRTTINGLRGNQKHHRRIRYIMVKEIHGTRCSRCQLDNERLMELHHRDPETKSFNISSWSVGDLEVLRQEILKCELLCVNCHRLDTTNALDVYSKDRDFIINEFDKYVVVSIDKQLRCDPKKFNNKMIIYADEWVNRRSLFEILVSGCNNLIKVRPQACNIKIIDHNEASKFYDLWHYAGGMIATYNIGVFLGDLLIACMSIRRPSRQLSGDWEISRMAKNLNYKAYGIWSYLIKWIKDNNIVSGKLVTFSDNRLFDGHMYEKIGFKYDYDVKPSYYWVMDGVRYNKSSLRKTAAEIDSGLTEVQLRVAQGYHKIIDAGKKKWTMFL